MKSLKILLFVLFAILSVSIASCSDDGEFPGGTCAEVEEFVSKDSLIGAWQCTWAEGYEKYTYNPEYSSEWNKMPEDLTATFMEDGTIVVNQESGKWQLESDKLTTVFEHREILEVDERVFTVLKLTGTELIIERTKQGVDYDYYDKLTFKKLF